MTETIKINFKYILAGLFLSFILAYSIYGTLNTNQLNTEIFNFNNIQPVISVNS